MDTLSAPIQLQWETTWWCNQECIHCYNHWRTGTKRKPRITQDVARLWEKVTDEIIANDTFEVTVTGGEPLSVMKDCLPFFKKLSMQGIEVSLNSNLTLLTKDMAVALRDVGVEGILVSLPSSDLETSRMITQRRRSLVETTRGIDISLRAGFSIAVNMVVSRVNIGQIYQTAVYVAGLGVKTFYATKASRPGNCRDFSDYALSLDELRHMLSELIRVRSELGLEVDSIEFYPLCLFSDEATRKAFGSDRSCSAGRTSCTVGFDGRIRPCSHAFQTYGEIDDGLLLAWQRMEEWRSNEWIPERCIDCSLKFRCRGGCKIEAFLVNGSLSKPDPYCDFERLPVIGNKQRNTGSLPRLLRFNPKLKVREESFGGILYVGKSKWAPVNSELYRFAISKKGGKIFGLSELALALNARNEEVAETANWLVFQSILLPLEVENERDR